MCSNPLGLHIWFLVRPFVYFHTLCVQTVKALAKLRRCKCAVSPEPSLFAYAISTIISSWLISWSKFSQVVFGNWDGPLIILPNLWQIQTLTSNLQAKHGILTYSPCRAQTCMATIISDQEIKSQGCSQLTHNSNLHAYYQGCLRCKHNTCCKRKLIGCIGVLQPFDTF